MAVQWTRSVNQLRMRRVLLGQCPPISVPSGRLLQEGSEEAYVRRIVGLWMWHWGLVMGFHRSDIGIRRYILDLNLEGLFQSGWFCGSTRSWVIWRASQCTCSVYSKILLILEQFQSWSRFTESGPLLPAFPVHTSTTSCPENICCAPAGMFSWKEKREINVLKAGILQKTALQILRSLKELVLFSGFESLSKAAVSDFLISCSVIILTPLKIKRWGSYWHLLSLKKLESLYPLNLEADTEGWEVQQGHWVALFPCRKFEWMITTFNLVGTTWACLLCVSVLTTNYTPPFN